MLHLDNIEFILSKCSICCQMLEHSSSHHTFNKASCIQPIKSLPCNIHTGSSRLMRISLLRFFKPIYKILLMQNLANANFFQVPKFALGKNPLKFQSFNKLSFFSTLELRYCRYGCSSNNIFLSLLCRLENFEVP